MSPLIAVSFDRRTRLADRIGSIVLGRWIHRGVAEDKRNGAVGNLISLHRREKELRSLATIDADPALSDHWNLVAEAMNAIYAFTHDHAHSSENELTLQYLGTRLFNAAGASVKLALSGYYQKAFHQVRDIIETSLLVDYLSTYPDKIDKWKSADKKQRIAQFGPGFIRNALDRRGGYTSGERKKITTCDLRAGLAPYLLRHIVDCHRAGQHGASRTVLRRDEASDVATGDGFASEPHRLVPNA